MLSELMYYVKLLWGIQNRLPCRATGLRARKYIEMDLRAKDLVSELQVILSIVVSRQEKPGKGG